MHLGGLIAESVLTQRARGKPDQVESRTLKAIISQQAAIKDLATRVQDSITEIDRRRAEMTKGIATLSAAEEASYSAHRAEKQAFLEELAKLI